VARKVHVPVVTDEELPAMSSKDDQISSNRRRLFKALSAAPVVAAMNPGHALANASAYQCAMKLRENPPRPFLTASQVPNGAVPDENGILSVQGYLYRSVKYWVKPDADRPTSRDCFREGYQPLPQYVVLFTDLDEPTNLTKAKLLAGDGTLLAADGAPPTIVQLKKSDPNVLEYGRIDGGNFVVCGEISPAKNGFVAYVGQTTGNDSGWNGLGFVPEFRISDNTQPGALQGMTESCMHSFAHGNMSLIG
jgi:hypothetical protein